MNNGVHFCFLLDMMTSGRRIHAARAVTGTVWRCDSDTAVRLADQRRNCGFILCRTGIPLASDHGFRHVGSSVMTYLQIQLVVVLSFFPDVRTVQIYNCANNKVEIFEDAPVPVTCGGIASDRNVTWRRRDRVDIGECPADGTSCTNTYLYNDYSLSRSPQSTESRLTLLPEYRHHAGVTVSCTDSISTASCTLVIRRHAVLSECDVTTDTVRGSVSGSCRVQGGYSSDNDYSCRWTVNNQSFGVFDSARETCSFTQPLPQESGLYTYTIAVFPPSTAGFSQTVTITERVPATTATSTAVIVGTVVAVIGLAAAVTTVVLWRKRKGVREKGPDVQVTPSAVDAVRYTEVNDREITVVTNSGQPQISNDENPQSAVYENAEGLPDTTYDATCPRYEEHRYSGLQVRATGSANISTGGDLSDGTGRDITIYDNLI